LKYNLNDIKYESNGRKGLDFIVEMGTISYYGDEIKILTPIHVTGALYSLENNIFLTCNIATKMETTCSRCLQTFTYEYNTSINTELVQEKNIKDVNDVDSDDDILIYKEDIIDLAKIIEENIIINIPMKLLCSESCKGLCLKCGKDLNTHNCNCEVDEDDEDEKLDPRLSKLKQLLDQD